MAGALIKISEDTVTSSQSSVTLSGIDSTYDVHMLVVNDFNPVTTNSDVHFRFTESSSATTNSDYDESGQSIRADATFNNLADTNRAFFVGSGSLNNTDGKGFNMIVYIFNAANSSMDTHVTIETIYMAEDTTTMLGIHGGGVYTHNSAVDGVQISCEGPTSNILRGKFTLYGLAKS
tara:strand:- start:207 stop:737 length:531 start_codon:yes stop_codon:yes gene_type:complete